MTFEVLIIGGGLAGLSAAIALAHQGVEVAIIEKNNYPKHKVCGEYVSNEVLPFLESIGFDPFIHGAQKIDELLISGHTGKPLSSTLKMGGFSLSRYVFDAALADIAREVGIRFIQDTVIHSTFSDNRFTLSTKTGDQYVAKVVIGAHGKRSLIDKNLDRKFIQKSAPYLAVKAHYRGEFPSNIVALHNFPGGYCGVSKIEEDRINACYITDYSSFKKYRNIENFQREVVEQNLQLKQFFSHSTPLFDQSISIGQISFLPKSLISNHILMCGDSAGMIHPLCGNGMSIAIQSAQIASHLVGKFLNGSIPLRSDLELQYHTHWNRVFKSRLQTGRFLARLFRQKSLSKYLLFAIGLSPWLLPKIIEKTHGKPLAMS